MRDYLAKLREVDLTFENGAAVVEKYRSKYPELSNHIQRIVPEERRIEVRQNLGDDADLRLHLFVIRILDDDALYEVTLSGEEEHKTVKSSEWLSLLHYEGEKEGRLLNVSYDPTREVYQEINSKFVAKFEAETQVSRKHVISTPVIGDRHSFFVFREGNSPKG